LVSAAAAGKRSNAARRRTVWQFVLPALLLLALVAGFPLARTIELSFTDARLGESVWSWIGLENYRAVLTDPGWWSSVGNTLFFAAVSVAIETVLGMVFALVMDVNLPGRGAVRAAILVPWAIPTVVSAQIWNWMFNDIYGVLNKLLMAVGLIHQPVAWTADPHLAMWAIIMVDVWKTTPFMALLSLAALQLVPQELKEAAEVDGVGPVRSFFYVTLPVILPALLVAVIFRLLDALRIFDAIYVLTGNNETTMSMSIYARRGLMDFQDAGGGSAAATLLFLIVAVASGISLTLARGTLAQDRA
jgi:trehalose/maltose transport system permease protein